jgi:NADH-quinone oxidoreductase subunit A
MEILLSITIFLAFGAGFVFMNMAVGALARSKVPNAEKSAVYECGEPTIGSSFVQFDLRFYVVALLFIIFDVEIAFFFPWAVVFGKATHLMDPHYQPVVQTSADGAPIGQPGKIELATGTRNTLAALGVPTPALPKPQGDVTENTAAIRDTAASLARTSIVDILVFFAVLLVGFAYVWMRGDLDWVRAVSRQRAGLPLPTPPASDAMEEAALSA